MDVQCTVAREKQPNRLQHRPDQKVATALLRAVGRAGHLKPSALRAARHNKRIHQVPAHKIQLHRILYGQIQAEAEVRPRLNQAAAREAEDANLKQYKTP